MVCAESFAPEAEVDDSTMDGDFTDTTLSLHPSKILDLLSNLLDKSMVRVVPDQDTSHRLLNTIQQFAWEKLGESGEHDHLRNQHLRHYLKLAERANPMLKRAEQSIWLSRLELEHDNLHAALAWSLQIGSIEDGLRLACALGEFWWRRGYLSEGIEWLDRLLARDHPANVSGIPARIHPRAFTAFLPG